MSAEPLKMFNALPPIEEPLRAGEVFLGFNSWKVKIDLDPS